MDAPYPDPAPDARWEIWHQDTFDRAAPRTREASGRGLQAGLVELWSRHLREGIDEEGRPTFARFNLWWPQTASSVAITGYRSGAARLRRWLRPGRAATGAPDEPRLSRARLLQIAHAHGRLLLAGQNSAPLLELARDAAHWADFARRLSRLSEPAE